MSSGFTSPVVDRQLPDPPIALDELLRHFSDEADMLLKAGVPAAVLGEALIEIGIKLEVASYGAAHVAERLLSASARIASAARY